MKLQITTRTARRLGIAALIAAACGLALGAVSIPLAEAVRPDFIEKHTGVLPEYPGQLDIVSVYNAPNHVGDPVEFRLRTAAGQTKPSALPTGYPTYPGAKVVRSAAFEDDGHTISAEVLVVPTSTAGAVAWYKSRLSAEGWKQAVVPASFAPPAYQADRDGVRIRIDDVNDASFPSSSAVTTISVYVSGP